MRIAIPIAVIIGGAFFCAPALAADTRSEVLERASHCNVLPEGRAWLDCYYGAAQPTRQVLGLTPAPQATQYQQVYTQPAGNNATPSDNRAAVLERAAHCSILPEGGAPHQRQAKGELRGHAHHTTSCLLLSDSSSAACANRRSSTSSMDSKRPDSRL